MNREPSRGAALVLTLLVLSIGSALALGLLLSSTVARMAAVNHDRSVELFNAAEAALELTARELAAAADWSALLDGSVVAAGNDGAPGVRALDESTVLDLPAMTNRLTCGRADSCSAAQVSQVTAERPFGPNNPRWRLFLHGPLPVPAGLPRDRGAIYAVAWVGDDAGESDGDPTLDGGAPDGSGRYVVRVRAAAFAGGGGRAAIEADVSRVCADAGQGPCLPGSRVQSWQTSGVVVP